MKQAKVYWAIQHPQGGYGLKLWRSRISGCVTPPYRVEDARKCADDFVPHRIWDTDSSVP